MNGERKLYPEEWAFILEFLNDLKGLNIVSPVLRNYESLPNRVGNDIDIFISKSALNKAEVIFKKCVSLHNGVLVKKYQKDTFTALWVQIGDAPLLHIDLFNGAFFWRGRCFESDVKVIEAARENSMGITIPRPSHQAFSMFITSLIWGGFYKLKYGEDIKRLLVDKIELNYFEAMMKINFPKSFPIPFDFTEPSDAEVIKKYTKSLRGNVKWRWLKRCDLIEAYRVARFWWWEIRSFWNPSGRWCFVDPSIDVSNCDLPIRDSLSLYGAVLDYSYERDSAWRWIWFRIRHLQRRMARNELILVKSPSFVMKRVFKRISGYPDFVILDEFQNPEFLSKFGLYYKCSENNNVWEKKSRKKNC